MTLMLKLKVKRFYRFCSRGGLRYLAAKAVFRTVKWKLSNSFKPDSTKRLYWIGPFSPIHGNVGDHAQTLGVRQFLRDYFQDYKIITIYRDDITVKLLQTISRQLRTTDLIFLQSSGDFGSLHDVASHHPGSISYPEVRRQIVKHAPAQCIINLPVTAYYEDTEKGNSSLEKDRAVFNDSQYMILCRESVSLKTVADSLNCKSLFFPDFVFYLKPKPSNIKRSGVQVILRSDKEAMLTNDQKATLIGQLRKSFSNVDVKDIMHEFHVIPDFILEDYMEKLFLVFQQRELIITDKMHGMISAVITGTPCIAISGGIPHKILAYKSFLSGAVEFVDDASGIENAVARIRERQYQAVDLSKHFQAFRANVLELP